MSSFYNGDQQSITKRSGFDTNITGRQTQLSYEKSASFLNEYRYSLLSYNKLFPPRTNIKSISIQPVAKQILTHKELDSEDEQTKRDNRRIQNLREQYTVMKQKREDQNQSTAINRERTPSRTTFKSMTETKAKKKVKLNGIIQSYSKPTNLEFELHKQRFLQTFLKGKGSVLGKNKSSEKLQTIKKKLVLQ